MVMKKASSVKGQIMMILFLLISFVLLFFTESRPINSYVLISFGRIT